MTLSQIKNARRRFLRELKPVMRQVDTAVEAMERELIRLLARKRDVPEADDLNRLKVLNSAVTSAATVVRGVLVKGFKN